MKFSTLSKACVIQHNDSLVYDGALSTFFQQIVLVVVLKTHTFSSQVHKIQKDKGVERLYKTIGEGNILFLNNISTKQIIKYSRFLQENIRN